VTDYPYYYYRRLDPHFNVAGYFRVRLGVYQNWDPATRTWVEVPGDYYSHAIEDHDSAIEKASPEEIARLG
jgi:hypothetical protein